ncbi:MAG: RagB/SusD family nutrient uptake outer membrane protein [Candidatus Bipolaricaulia bacterium]
MTTLSRLASLSVACLVLLAGLLSGCDSFLNYNPKGKVSGQKLNTPKKVEQLVTAAYAELGNDYWLYPHSNPWPYGSVRSDNSYKGGGSVSDQKGFDTYETFNAIRPDQRKADRMWVHLYRGISRANEALRRIKPLSEEEYPEKTTRMAEMRFVRGHFYFLAKIFFRQIPYLDETVPEDSAKFVGNRQFSDNYQGNSQALWDRIASDFQFAMENLPPPQELDVGRADKYAAMSYLAKTRLYQAYEKDQNHQVTNINTDRLQTVVDLINRIQSSGSYDLHDDFAKNFLWTFENGKESVFAVQRSINDGTPDGRVDMANGLNYTMNPEFGCCWFHIPSQNLVNAFQTRPNGLPEFQNYNQPDPADTDSAFFQTETFDPRLDHTVSIPKHPFKYDQSLIYDSTWARVPGLYGQFSSMKELQHPGCPCYKAVGPFHASSKNNVIIRYADVLLWKAEALIQLGRLRDGLDIINRIRRRAKNSKDRLTYIRNGSNFTYTNYNIQEYEPGQNITMNFEEVWRALRWERRLELAMESHRFFDLVRWGRAKETLSTYFAEESTRRTHLKDAKFTKGRDEYLPIPQQQIDFSEGLYKQNTGWN